MHIYIKKSSVTLEEYTCAGEILISLVMLWFGEKLFSWKGHQSDLKVHKQSLVLD